MQTFRIMLGVAAMLCGVACNRGDACERSKRAHQWVEQGATLLDVRTAQEWADGHLQGAMHIPVGELSGKLSEVPKDKPVVTYCARGTRATKAAEVLKKQGYKVMVLGGMSDWKVSGCK